MRILLLITSLFLIYGCSGNWTTYPAQPRDPLDSQLQIISIDDVLNINIFDETQLSGDYTVLKDGTIQIPLIGEIKVEKLSLKEASKKIETELESKGYLVNPKISLSISQQSKTVRIMGEVLTTGEYPYKEGMTLLGVVINAGGFSYRANQNEFDIIRRDENGIEKVIKGQISTRIMPGDIIRVRERYF
jgi:protein involved in polysaccharide export with SLBB domain